MVGLVSHPLAEPDIDNCPSPLATRHTIQPPQPILLYLSTRAPQQPSLCCRALVEISIPPHA